MKSITFIADIHGNKSAMEDVLKNIYNENIDTIYCFGDISAPFGGDEIWRILNDKQIPVIKNRGQRLLQTDIQGAKACGFRSVLMKSGKYTQGDENLCKPDLAMSNLLDFIALEKK